MCPLNHFEAVQFLCLTPKTPKAKDPDWRGLRHKGADQSRLCTGNWLGKNPGTEPFLCLFYWKQDSSCGAQGRKHGKFCPGSLPLGQHGERGMLKELEPMEMPLPA